MEDEDQNVPGQEIDFCTLGMFIIGETAYSLFYVMLLLFVYFSVEPFVGVTCEQRCY